MDYKLSEGSSIYVRAMYSQFKEHFDKSAYTLGDVVGADGTITGSAPKYSISGFRPDFAIGSLVTGGKHLFAGSWLSWDLSVARSRALDAATNPKGDFKAIGALKSLTACKYDPAGTTNAYRPQFASACSAAGASVFDASQYALKDIIITNGQAVQLNLQGSVAVGRDYHVGTHSAAFEIGAKVRNGHKFQDVATNTYLPIKGSILLNSFASGPADSGYYGGSYTQGPFANYGAMMGYFDANRSGFTLDSNATRLKSDPNNYGLIERVSAGYLMNTLQFGRFRLQTGVRFEGTQLNVLGYHVVSDKNGTYASTTPVSTQGSYLDVLPSVQLRYKLSSSRDIRAVYGRGISRPNPYDLVPYVNESDQAQTIAVGNPALKPEHANNFDLLFEQYVSSVGLIQAGYFYKDLTDPIYQFQSTLSSGAYNGYLQSQMANGSRAHLMGVEVSYQHYFRFLPGPFRGAGIAANYIHTASVASHLPGRSDNPALPRQTPNAWNIGPTWDRGRVSIRMGVSYNGSAIYAYHYQDRATTGIPLEPAPLGGLQGPKGDQYYYPHLQVDAQASVRLGRGLTAVVYGLNLNNEVFGYYNGSPQYVVQREYYARSIAGGVRWNLNPGQ